MQLIPALDVLGDDAVRLEQGDYDRVLFRQRLRISWSASWRPARPLSTWSIFKERDGALRPEVIERCRRSAGDIPLQVSGGIRSVDSARAALGAGAQRVIVGTGLWSDDEALDTFVVALGDQLVAALDVRNGQIAVRGWRGATGLSFTEALARCSSAGVTRVHVTAIDRDGTMRGPDLTLYEEACRTSVLVVAAGGVRDDADIEALADTGCEAAVMGMGYLSRIGL